MTTTTPDLRRALEAAGQEHVLGALERLDEAARTGLRQQLEAIDLELIGRLRAQIAGPSGGAEAPRFEPPELFPLLRGPEQESQAARAVDEGRGLLEAGRVGCVLVAGGQASRLGLDAPKGTFPVGPVSGRPLYELFARRLRAAALRHARSLPWYVMTSPANDAATRSFFEQHGHFGLDPGEVFFFSQEMLPALDQEGRMLFSSPDSLFLAPNGHGGVLWGLRSSGALEDMQRRGLRELSYFQVDNPLVRPADTLFLGLHALAGAEMSTKVVTKRDAGEKVGVIGRVDGRLGCIEYSDLPSELREARDPDGALRFRAGNIAVHVLSVDFVERITHGGLQLPWHVAKKRMAVDEDGRSVERDGYKFETFVFDALGLTRASVTLEVDRAEEFSPVKNATGEDSPATARADLCRLYTGWVRAAGLEPPPADAQGDHPVEVDPLLAESEQEFVARRPTPDVRPTGHLYE